MPTNPYTYRVRIYKVSNVLDPNRQEVDGKMGLSQAEAIRMCRQAQANGLFTELQNGPNGRVSHGGPRR